MPTRDSAPIGAPCWVDLYTSDPATSEWFYGELFGWTAAGAGEEYGGYINFSKDGRIVAGAMYNDGRSGSPDVWSVYLATDDAQATAADAAANGGQVLLAAMPVIDLGRMAVVADVGGATVGVWQPGVHTGFAVVGEPGTPSWFELHTREYDASVRFYEDVFHWDAHVASDAPELRYTTYGEGDSQLAGIVDAAALLPADQPAAWSIYFGVDDVDAVLALIVELGGSVIQTADDTPYGRLARAVDPTGATFRLVAGR
ncbi:MAG: VOC family protein [Ilumatobacteraceae bacterium]